MRLNERFDYALEVYENNHGERPLNINMAEAIGVSPGTMSKLKQGHMLLKEDQVKNLANYLGVTCDELLNGVAEENKQYNQEYGLSNAALEWFRNTYIQKPKLMDLINILFRNHKIADLLFESLFFFANTKALKLQQSDIFGESVYDVFNDTSIMTWAIVSQYLKTVFEAVQNYYSEHTVEPMQDTLIQKALKKLVVQKEAIDDHHRQKLEMDLEFDESELK